MQIKSISRSVWNSLPDVRQSPSGFPKYSSYSMISILNKPQAKCERTYMEIITCTRVKGAKIIARTGDEPITPSRSFEYSTRRMEIAIARVEVVNDKLRIRTSCKE
jgi:hypothetical protein